MNEYSKVGWQDGTVLQPAKVTIEGVDYDVDPAVESGTTPVNATNLDKMDTALKQAHDGVRSLNTNKIDKATIELLTVDSTAPATCSEGDMYYNTTTNLIYTATGTDTWGTTGETPSSKYLYVDLTNSKLYYYDGATFTSYGGGSSNDVVISPDQPTSNDWKLWINTDEVQNLGSEITNEYSESTKVGYSADYVNNLHTYSTDEVRIGTYLDKPLYRKTIETVFTIQYEENNTYFCWINPNISLINKARNIDCYAQGTDRKLTSSGGVALNYMTAGNNTGLIQIGIIKTLITNNTPIEITIEYTKTTD